MRQHRVAHTVSTATALMRVYAQLGLTSEACSLLAQLRAAGLSVQAHAYNTVMHGLAEAEDGDFLEIMQVFRRMWLYDGVAPDRQSFNALINASRHEAGRFGHLGQFFLAFVLESPVRVQADSFNVAIRSVLSQHQYMPLAQARQLLADMKEAKVKGNEHTFRTIFRQPIHNAAFGSKLEANRLLQTAVDCGARPSAAFMTQVIEDQAIRKGRLGQGVWLLGLATGYQLIPIKGLLALEKRIRSLVSADARVVETQRARMLMSLDKIHQIAVSRPKRPASPAPARKKLK